MYTHAWLYHPKEPFSEWSAAPTFAYQGRNLYVWGVDSQRLMLTSLKVNDWETLYQSVPAWLFVPPDVSVEDFKKQYLRMTPFDIHWVKKPLVDHVWGLNALCQLPICVPPERLKMRFSKPVAAVAILGRALT